jgi:hypothetical protein
MKKNKYQTECYNKECREHKNEPTPFVTCSQNCEKNKRIKVQLFFAWYDFWIGWFWDKKKKTLYICLLPCIVLKFWRELW